jgi:bifunctional non-homologous end joining protein LigD
MADRVLFPNGFTTADLVSTYLQLAPVLLPHLRNRPLTLTRFSTTIAGEAFWEKDAPSFTPKWVKRYAVARKAGGEPIQYISVPDVKTLRWAASVGCVEIHAFLHEYPYISSPTLIAFDLDPGEGMNVIDCCRVAIRLRVRLKEYGLECLPKTSGSKGMQVYVPLNTASSYGVTQAG